jgi:2-polyprenyl-3-methyl-5-hydroxy-6-metoxy-1,4-benzoquinol methylase
MKPYWKGDSELTSVMINPPQDVMHCRICGATNDRQYRSGYYIKCSECKVAFLERQESVAELDEYWETEFWNDEEIEKRKAREPVFREAFSLLRKLKPQGGSVLDIGCGIGTFLYVCREGGWNITGVEPSTTACQVAKREYGVDLINDAFASSLFPEKKFDAVFAAQVLHHLPDPAAFAADIARVLADDGVLILRTPNLIPLEVSLFLQRLLGREKKFFLGPALYTFHPKTLSLLFQRLGFADVSFANSRPFLEKPKAPWQAGQSLIANLRRLLIAVLKIGGYGTFELVHKLTGVVIGPSIFVIARKKIGAGSP